MSFTGLTHDEEQRMLKEIGVASFEALLAPVPSAVILKEPLPLAPARSEIELRQLLGGWARENAVDRGVSFMGGGCYDHYIPAAIGPIASRSEFATAYTPYQPEVAQGTLTAIFEFQSMIAELTGEDVANASLYDGATAVVEAALLARAQTQRPRVVVAGALHPHYQAVLRTYLESANVTVVKDQGGCCAAEDLRGALGPDVACVIYQQPNFFGLIENPRGLHAMAHEIGALAIAACDPIALALLEPPGKSGADIVVGEGQPLGVAPSLGGPALGFFACRQALVRRMPGRLVAETVDVHGQRGFVLTLQTREQHIRREKATSNICTNQGLLMLCATIYMALMGQKGMREVAELCVQKSRYAAQLASAIPGFRRAHTGPFFREFVLECPVAAREIVLRGAERGVLPGIDLGRFGEAWKRWLLVAVTEQRSAQDLERWAELLRSFGGKP